MSFVLRVMSGLLAFGTLAACAGDADEPIGQSTAKQVVEEEVEEGDGAGYGDGNGAGYEEGDGAGYGDGNGAGYGGVAPAYGYGEVAPGYGYGAPGYGYGQSTSWSMQSGASCDSFGCVYW